jgi:hypothetical protein
MSGFANQAERLFGGDWTFVFERNFYYFSQDCGNFYKSVRFYG